MGGDLTWGGKHTIQCADDVLQTCAPETCIIVLTSVTTMIKVIIKIKASKSRITKNQSLAHVEEKAETTKKINKIIFTHELSRHDMEYISYFCFSILKTME